VSGTARMVTTVLIPLVFASMLINALAVPFCALRNPRKMKFEGAIAHEGVSA